MADEQTPPGRERARATIGGDSLNLVLKSLRPDESRLAISGYEKVRDRREAELTPEERSIWSSIMRRAKQNARAQYNLAQIELQDYDRSQEEIAREAAGFGFVGGAWRFGQEVIEETAKLAATPVSGLAQLGALPFGEKAVTRAREAAEAAPEFLTSSPAGALIPGAGREAFTSTREERERFRRVHPVAAGAGRFIGAAAPIAAGGAGMLARAGQAVRGGATLGMAARAAIKLPITLPADAKIGLLRRVVGGATYGVGGAAELALTPWAGVVDKFGYGGYLADSISARLAYRAAKLRGGVSATTKLPRMAREIENMRGYMSRRQYVTEVAVRNLARSAHIVPSQLGEQTAEGVNWMLSPFGVALPEGMVSDFLLDYGFALGAEGLFALATLKRLGKADPAIAAASAKVVDSTEREAVRVAPEAVGVEFASGTPLTAAQRTRLEMLYAEMDRFDPRLGRPNFMRVASERTAPPPALRAAIEQLEATGNFERAQALRTRFTVPKGDIDIPLAEAFGHKRQEALVPLGPRAMTVARGRGLAGGTPPPHPAGGPIPRAPSPSDALRIQLGERNALALGVEPRGMRLLAQEAGPSGAGPTTALVPRPKPDDLGPLSWRDFGRFSELPPHTQQLSGVAARQLTPRLERLRQTLRNYAQAGLPIGRVPARVRDLLRNQDDVGLILLMDDLNQGAAAEWLMAKRAGARGGPPDLLPNPAGRPDWAARELLAREGGAPIPRREESPLSVSRVTRQPAVPTTDVRRVPPRPGELGEPPRPVGEAPPPPAPPAPPAPTPKPPRKPRGPKGGGKPPVAAPPVATPPAVAAPGRPAPPAVGGERPGQAAKPALPTASAAAPSAINTPAFAGQMRRLKNGQVAEVLEVLPPTSRGQFVRVRAVADADVFSTSSGGELTIRSEDFEKLPTLRREDLLKAKSAASKPRTEADSVIHRAAVLDTIKRTGTVDDDSFANLGPGHKKLLTSLNELVETKTLTPDERELMKLAFARTDDYGLSFWTVEPSDLPRPMAGFTATLLKSRASQTKIRAGLAAEVAATGNLHPRAKAAHTFLHEYGHHGYYLSLTPRERRLVETVFAALSPDQRASLFAKYNLEIVQPITEKIGRALGGKIPAQAKAFVQEELHGRQYASSNPPEFFADMFADYVFFRQSRDKRLLPLIKRVFNNMRVAIKRFLGGTAPEDLKRQVREKFAPLFEKAWEGKILSQGGDVLVRRGANRTANFDIERVARGYHEKNAGRLDLGPIESTPIMELDPTRSRRIADAFAAMKHAPNEATVKAAYSAFAHESVEQYKHLVDEGKLKVELFGGKGEPYKDSATMIADVRDNNHLFILRTEKAFGAGEKLEGANPLLANSGLKDANGQPMLVNDAFRAVHDYLGHSLKGNAFGPLGEEVAWSVHAPLFSPLARRAMTTETRGQNSWVNFGPHMRGKKGELLKKGDEGFLAAPERPFAEQKVGLLPEEFSRIDNTPDIVTAFNRLSTDRESLTKVTRLYHEGKEGANWYKGNDAGFIVHAFGDDATTFVKMLAATSPNATVSANMTLALKAYQQWKMGEPFKGYLGSVKESLEAVVRGDPNWGGKKVSDFSRALLLDEDVVVVDRWMGRAFGLERNPTPKQYDEIANAVRQEAAAVGATPAEYQAAVWTAIRKVKAPGLTAKPINTLARQRLAQIQLRLFEDEPLAEVVARGMVFNASPEAKALAVLIGRGKIKPIKALAIKMPDGQVAVGRPGEIHYQAWGRIMELDPEDYSGPKAGEFGFIDQAGRYLTREEATRVIERHFGLAAEKDLRPTESFRAFRAGSLEVTPFDLDDPPLPLRQEN